MDAAAVEGKGVVEVFLVAAAKPILSVLFFSFLFFHVSTGLSEGDCSVKSKLALLLAEHPSRALHSLRLPFELICASQQQHVRVHMSALIVPCRL
eukprot:1162046-Pelagomonas_calceolata.AAC.10